MRIVVAGSIMAACLHACPEVVLSAHGQDVAASEALHRVQFFGQVSGPAGDIQGFALSMEVPVDWEIMSPDVVLRLREQMAEQAGGDVDFGFLVGAAGPDGVAGDFLVGDVQWTLQPAELSQIAASLGAERLSTLPDSDGWRATHGSDGWVYEQPTGFLWTRQAATAPAGARRQIILSYFTRDRATVALRLESSRLASDSWANVRRIGATFRIDLDPAGDDVSADPPDLVPGIWSLVLGGELEWKARIEPGVQSARPRISILADGEQMEATDVTLQDGVLSLTVGPAEDPLSLRCTLHGQADGSYAGRCMNSDGRGAVVRLTPPD